MAPAVSGSLGIGGFHVEGTKPSMSGWREVDPAIGWPAGSDNVAFDTVF